MDAVATLVHCIQAMRDSGHAGALLLFDISGFFDNINPSWVTHILCNMGFPMPLCDWVLSFLTDRRASLKLGNHISAPFPLSHGTPQGLPLSPILSVIYTSTLLTLADSWELSDLTLYVDDGAIFATSATTVLASLTTVARFKQVLQWLSDNSLSADPTKTELMVFSWARPQNLIGGHIFGTRYRDSDATHRITTVTRLRYLSVFLTNMLSWQHHVTIMANCARSTIWGISILGNSVHGLDFLNWRHVYNALVIPVLTYGAPVWYTGVCQKGLLARLQVAQNDGLRKIMGVFKTTPIEPLHNLTRIPLIPYLMRKLMHSYTLRLGRLPPTMKVRTVLTADRCQYWPDHTIPETNLSHASTGVGPSTYRAPSLCTAREWAHPHLTYLLNPPEHITLRHKQSRECPEASDTHIYILPTSRGVTPITSYHITQGTAPTHRGLTTGVDHT